MDSCAVCALHKVLGQGGKKELELCTQPGPLGGSAQGREGHLSVISTEVPYSLAVTLGLGKEKRESRKDKLYRGRQLPSQTFTSLSSPRPREAGSCAVSPGLASSDPGAGPGSPGHLSSPASPVGPGKVVGGGTRLLDQKTGEEASRFSLIPCLWTTGGS